MLKLQRVLVYLWIALLAVSLYISARTSYRRALATEEFAYACDSFGYLRMAKELRHAYEHGTWPRFELESPQTRLLINFMLQSNVPSTRWDEAFAIAAWKRAWATIGLVVLALTVGFMVMARLGALSFSMNAGLVPILLTSVLTLIALRLKTADRDGLALLFALLAGMSLGVATMVRLPSFLLSAGFLVLLWPGLRNFRIKSLPVVFALGVTITGVIPVVINQHFVAGAWYLTTYSRA